MNESHMIFIVVSFVIPILTYWLLPKMLGKFNPSSRKLSKLPLVLAGIAFFISWYLPSPEIQGEQTAAITHFIGGGIFTGLVWLYVWACLGRKTTWLVELMSLLALVSLLGVLNELFELFIVNIGLVDMSLTDTSWDLLMNTLGATTVWVIYTLHKHRTKLHRLV
jgi:hypothetical protein